MNKIVGRLKFNLKGILLQNGYVRRPNERDVCSNQFQNDERHHEILLHWLHYRLQKRWPQLPRKIVPEELREQILHNHATFSQYARANDSKAGWWFLRSMNRNPILNENGKMDGTVYFVAKINIHLTFSRLKIKTELTINKESFYKPSNTSFSCVSSKIHACN